MSSPQQHAVANEPKDNSRTKVLTLNPYVANANTSSVEGEKLHMKATEDCFVNENIKVQLKMDQQFVISLSVIVQKIG